MSNSFSLFESVFNSLEEQIAVIDKKGTIIAVNLAWQAFGLENGLTPDKSFVKHNYLQIVSASAATGDRLAGEALQGIMDVLDGKLASFLCEYPCHSLHEKRWFIMRITALHGDESNNLFVISHNSVTQRKLAEERAMLDSLTSLANRRAFNMSLSNEIRSSVRNQIPIGLALIDVDHFKQCNDVLGHTTGDKYLINIADVLRAHARRPYDLAARVGGDEFALILPNTGLDNLRDLAESIIKSIRDLHMVIDDSTQVTVSIGLLSIIPDERHNEDFLFSEADKALYSAKNAGRNQAIFSSQITVGQTKSSG